MGPFGSSIKVDTFVPEGVSIMSGNHLRTFLLEDSTHKFITEEHAQKLHKAAVSVCDIVFTHAGNIGNLSLVPKNPRYPKYVISQRQFFLRCNLAKVSPNYVILYFASEPGKSRLLANASSVGVPSIARPVTYLSQSI
jgi:type I restriction enzyme, S subunit